MSQTRSIGAFFDLDGTLLPAPSVERRFIFFLLMHGLFGPPQLVGSAARFILSVARNSRAGSGSNKAHFRGVPVTCVQKWREQFASRPLRLFSAGVRRLESHFAKGHRIFLITGAPTPLAELVARYLPVTATIVGTRLGVRGGLWTGDIMGEHMNGAAKQRAIIRLAAAHDLNLSRSFAYGDSGSDIGMLETVGYPAAVNPSKNLERLACARNWSISRWRETLSPRAGNSCDMGQSPPAFDADFAGFTEFSGANQ
ncbi:MAG TPA: HAD-IB family hydrolase [Candidatus Acidoferrales bacterium]|nr:HAD-IB family hydrolase [Candidatus Acidoferrales bacterium]